MSDRVSVCVYEIMVGPARENESIALLLPKNGGEIKRILSPGDVARERERDMQAKYKLYT